MVGGYDGNGWLMPRRVVRREYVTDEPEVVEQRTVRSGGAGPYWYANPVGLIAAALIVLLVLFLLFGML